MVEEDALRGNTKSLVHNEDFEVFYCLDETEDISSSLRLTTTLVSENQETTDVPKAMVLEKRIHILLSLLESHARTAIPKVPIVPRPSTLIPPPPSQTELIDKKKKGTK